MDYKEIARSLVGNPQALKAFMALMNHNQLLRDQNARLMLEKFPVINEFITPGTHKVAKYLRVMSRLIDDILSQAPEGSRQTYFKSRQEKIVAAADHWLAACKLPPVYPPTKEKEDVVSK